MGYQPQIADNSPFTLRNIPFGVISTKDDKTPRPATAIGDDAIDLRALSRSGFFKDTAVADALSQVSLPNVARGLGSGGSLFAALIQ